MAKTKRRVGDVIDCHNIEDAMCTILELEEEGYKAEMVNAYENIIVITSVPEASR